MIFVDTSAYLSILLPRDVNQNKASQILKKIISLNEQLITSYAVLGEILTVGSMRYDKKTTIKFVEDILSSKTVIVSERRDLLDSAFKIFKAIPDKNVSFVDCYSFAIIKDQKVEQAFSFDRDFQKYARVLVLN